MVIVWSATPAGSRATVSGGFTLLEMLVAVVVLTLVMGAAFGAVRLSDRSYATSVEVSRWNEQMRGVSDFLRRHLGELVAVRKDDELPAQIFAGKRDEFTFVAPAPAGFGEGGLLAYRLSVRPFESVSELVLTHYLIDPGTQQPIVSTVRERVLVSDLESVSFGYFGRGESDNSPRQWRDIWPADAVSPPELLSIRLYPRSGVPVWPELLLRIQPEPSA